jgi:diguanylate cyclase (GGDEF)-like protein
MPVWTKRSVVALALVSLSLLLVPTPAGRDGVQTLVQVGCLALAWYHVRRHRSVIRLGWGLLVVAVTLLGVSDMLAALERHFHVFVHGPTPSNLVALTGYVLLGLSVLQLDRNRSRGRRLPGAIEAAIFATGALAPVLVFLILPILARDDMTPAAKAITVAYALADLVVITVIARLMLTDGGQSRAFAYLSIALFTSLAGDIWSWVTTVDGGPSSTTAVVKLLWLSGFVFFAAGIAHPSMVTFTSGGAWSEDAPRQRRVWLMGLGQAMPAGALMFVWIFDRTSSILFIAVGGLVVSLLVSARMNGLLDRISEQSSKLEDLARSDELTGLHNRRSWNFELARACEVAAAGEQPLAVGLLDLDRFKSYNDTYGHPAGDRLLRSAAEAWQSALRPGEVLARYGGEEFAILMPGTGLDDAVQRVDALRVLTPGGQSFSAGVTLWVEGSDPEQTVADADVALYQAKRQGRDRVLPFRSQTPRAQPYVPYALRSVVQPIVRMSDLSIVAYEALSRFDPSTDVEAVFAQAHEQGYGDVLESSAILSGLRFPDRPPSVELFVNVSERAMASPHFWQTMPARMDGVVVELHEGRHGLDDTTISRMLDRFRDRGARVCLDDLVASQEDLDRIVSLRPDLVKIDRSLVAGCDTQPGQVALIERLTAFARGYGVRVCAEGVETVEELLTLRSLGIPLVQGYLLGRPESHWAEPLQPSFPVGVLPDLPVAVPPVAVPPVAVPPVVVHPVAVPPVAGPPAPAVTETSAL